MPTERQIRFQIRDLNEQLFAAPSYLQAALKEQLIGLWSMMAKVRKAALKPAAAK